MKQIFPPILFFLITFSQQTIFAQNADGIMSNSKDVIYDKTITNIAFKNEIVNPGTVSGRDGFAFNDIIYQDAHDIYNRPLDKTLAVGTLPAVFNVSLSGAANYSMPIDVPPGTAGMQPAISIEYNSQGGNGLLGMGFNLSALSLITRTGANMFNDNFVHGVSFDLFDKYLLDGQRLISYGSIPYGTDHAEYRTEIESFSKIVSYEQSGYGPKYFKVWTKDGKILEYGNTEDSRIERQSINGDNTVITWLCNRITDVNGNYLTFTYYENSSTGEWLIKEINYTGNDNAGITPYNKIKFIYAGNRTDKNTFYVWGSKIEQNNLLVAIQTFCEGALLKEYKLNYSFDFYSHLSEVELAAQGQKINSTVFKWGETVVPDDVEIVPKDIAPNFTGTTYTITEGDFNGDGLTDIFRVNYNNNTKNWTLCLANINNGSNIVSYTEIGPKNFIDYSTGVPGGVAIDYKFSIACDPNSDGKSELLIVSGGSGSVYDFYWNNNNGGTFDIRKLWQHGISINYSQAINNGIITQRDVMPECLQIGDFNGNGIPEFWSRQIGTFGGTIKYYWNCYEYRNCNDGPDIELIMGYPIITLLLGVQKILLADFNGDGKSEILVGNEIYEDYNGTFYLLNTIDNSFNLNDWDLKYIRTADFNGDGIADVLYNDLTQFGTLSIQYNSKWNAGIYNGKDHFDFKELINISKTVQNINDYKDYVDCADLNGDGKTDIILREYENQNPYTPTYKLSNIYYSLGSNEWETKVFNFIIINQFANSWKAERLARNGFFSYIDLDNHIDYYDGEQIISFAPYDKNQLVTQIKNGFNSGVSLEYNTILDPDHYHKSTDAIFPYMNMFYPIYVVSHSHTDNGSNHTSDDYEFKYENAQLHLLGKGFLGFGKVTDISYTQSAKQLTYFGKVANLPFPIIEKTQSLDLSDNILNETVNTYKIKQFYGRYCPYIYKTIATDNIHNISSVSKIERNAEPDEYGNIGVGNPTVGKYITESYRAGNSTSEWTTTTENTYDNIINPHNGPRILGLIKKTEVTKQNNYQPAPNDNQYVRKSEFKFNQRGQILQETIEPDDQDLITINNSEYYSTGLLKKSSTTVKVDGVDKTRYSNLEYDPKFRFVTKKINQLGHNNIFEYDPRYGNVTKSTDANNHVTTSAYDAFGNLIKTTSPDGIVTQVSKQWATGGGNTPYGTVVTTTTTQTGLAPVIIYTDRLAREMRTETKNFNNKIVFTDKTYDTQGRLVTESLPYFQGGAKQDITYTYEAITNRIKTVIGPTQNIVYDYNGTTVQTTDNIMGITTEQTMDAAGNIISSTDPGGTMIYHYYSSGLTGEIIDPSGNAISMEYDLLGRQIKLNDPDAGTTSYTYTGFGELETQTDARGMTTELKYDDLGRVVESKVPNEKTIYQYDTKPNGKGLPATINNLDNSGAIYNKEEYNYDNLSRIISLQTAIKNPLTGTLKYFHELYNYDNLGRLQDYTYPSGFKIRNNYNSITGELWKVMDVDQNKPIWRCNTVNALGQITGFTKGAGMNTFLQYEAVTHLLNGIKTFAPSTNHSAPGIQNLTYTYNNKYQLAGRSDLRQGFNLTETFEYDNLNRLTSITGQSQNTALISYDPNGNIVHKTDVGIYEYDQNKIHAVNLIRKPDLDLVTPPYDLKKQDITYTPYNKVKHIAEGNYTYDIVNGTEQQRIMTELKETGTNNGKRKYYLGNYELEENLDGTNKRELFYIGCSDGLAAIGVKTNNGNVVMHYVHTDIQGSYNVITDEDGNIEENLNFDAWGRTRNPQTWEFYMPGTEPVHLFDRGYTGHEHLEKFGLINMNGRMYDPLLARMLSPDPFVQAGAGTQSYNRYSYCFNNPLSFTDPSGYVAYGSGLYGNYLSPNESGYNSSQVRYNDYLDMLYGRGYHADDPYNGISELFIYMGSTLVSSGSEYGGCVIRNYSPEFCFFSIIMQEQGQYIRISNVGSKYSDFYIFNHNSTKNFKEIDLQDFFIESKWYSWKDLVNASNKGDIFYSFADKEWRDNGFNSLKFDMNISGSVDFNGYRISSSQLKLRLIDFAHNSGYNISITGGDRTVKRNKAIGGAKNSQHLYGIAADIKSSGISNKTLAISAQNSNLFNTVIYYPKYNDAKALGPHVHIDLNTTHNNVLMIYKRINGKNTYNIWNP